VVGATSTNTAATKAFSLTSAGGINVLTDINAGTGITLKASSIAAGIGISLDGKLNASGKNGSVTLTAAGLGGINAVALSDISAAKSVTLTAPKGTITVDSLGQALAPQTISLTSVDTITTNAKVQAVSAITFKVTGKASGDITVFDDLLTTSAVANTGTITMSSAAGQVSVLPGADLSAGKSVTLSAPKSTVGVDTIGQVRMPGTVSLTALTSVSNGGLVKAGTSVTEKATDTKSSSFISVVGSILAGSGNTGTVSLTAAHNDISCDPGTDISGGKSVTLSAAKGMVTVNSIGASLTSGAVKITSLQSLTVNGAIKAGASATLAATDKSAGSVEVNSISTVDGPISVTAAAGALKVDALASIISNSPTTKSKITLLNKNTTTGTITIGGGAQIQTVNLKPGANFGSVNIAIGAVPGASKSTALTSATGVSFNPAVQPAKPVFFGTSLVTYNADALNTVEFKSVGGAKVIMDTSKSALGVAAITINGGATPTRITADPPLAAAAQEILIAPTMTGQSALNLNSAANVVLSGGLTAYSGVAPITAVQSNFVAANNFLPALQASLTNTAGESLTGRTLFGSVSGSAVTGPGSVPTETIFVGSRDGARSYEIDSLWSEGENSSAPLNQGNIFVAAKKDTVIDTAFGKVTVGAGSMALIMTLPGGTAVYNFDDNRRDSVVISNGDKRISLPPGGHATITSRMVPAFELVNGAEVFAYRNVASRKLDDKLQLFTAEFSVPHAIAMVKPLRALINGGGASANARRQANHMLKTAAIVAQLSNGRGYQQYPHPRLTASALHQ